jgi:hypothetical protein
MKPGFTHNFLIKLSSKSIFLLNFRPSHFLIKLSSKSVKNLPHAFLAARRSHGNNCATPPLIFMSQSSALVAPAAT